MVLSIVVVSPEFCLLTADPRVALPEGGTGPGLVLIHEIFGVNVYVRSVAERLAGLGYVVLAPDLFWHTAPGHELGHSQEEMQRGMQAAQQLDSDLATRDAATALQHLRDLPEVTGKAGIMGHCLGGTYAFRVAIAEDPDTAVCYYGGGIPDLLAEADEITCPVLLHFGGEDQFMDRAAIDRVAALAAQHPNLECHIQEGAGHAFDNTEAEAFHQPEPAAAAWELTRQFLTRTLDN